MEIYKVEDFFKGWVVGDFSPSLHRNSDFEMAVKFFQKGDTEAAHMQLIATEITVVIEGEIRLGGSTFTRGNIISIPPNEVAAFESITDSSLVCIKFPSIPNDKVVIDEKD
jgi:quercetin dioxygenase-like cupin family protein